MNNAYDELAEALSDYGFNMPTGDHLEDLAENEMRSLIWEYLASSSAERRSEAGAMFFPMAQSGARCFASEGADLQACQELADQVGQVGASLYRGISDAVFADGDYWAGHDFRRVLCHAVSGRSLTAKQRSVAYQWTNSVGYGDGVHAGPIDSSYIIAGSDPTTLAVPCPGRPAEYILQPIQPSFWGPGEQIAAGAGVNVPDGRGGWMPPPQTEADDGGGLGLLLLVALGVWQGS